MLVNCPGCKEQIEIPRSTGSQPPKVPVSATPPPLPPAFTPPPPPIPRPSLSRASLTVADHDRVPGLERPVSLSEYAELEGFRLADALAAIRQRKIPTAYFRWRWWVEAPPNSEARLAQLRANKHDSIPELISRLRQRFAKQEHTQPTPQPQRPQTPLEPQPRDDGQRPQPIDYGLTYDDLNLYDGVKESCRLNDVKVIPSIGRRPDDKYKEGKQWFGVLYRWRHLAYLGVLPGFLMAVCGLMAFGYVKHPGEALLPLIVLGFGIAGLLSPSVPEALFSRLRAHPSPGLIAYWQSLHSYDQAKAAERAAENQAQAAAEAAARKAARDAELRKRSYWAFLDGYEFERATAEVMQKHQFNAVVTRGSGDGGIDIEVTRNGLKGIVQCKAHTSCVGPHVVRDLYGVIHHSGVSFGIVVSRGGFTRGAHDFRRDKPILFLDTDDLIAMQEGRDVLAAAFSDSQSARAND